MEAHNNLGVQHLKANATRQRWRYFQKAVELDPGAREPLVNLAADAVTMERPKKRRARPEAIRLMAAPAWRAISWASRFAAAEEYL